MAATETSARANEVLDELYRRHVGDVYRYTYAVLGNHADAEDVTQTTFVNALRALERGEIPDEPSRWLTVIAHNLVRQRWRQAASRPALVELETDVPDVPEDDEGFELEELVRALQRIPETQREAIVMRELEGRSYREIATVLGLSTSALETLLFRARRSLADELENVVTCQNAELAISKRQDGLLSRKERRRLDEHLAECPDCARLAATQQRQRRAFKGLALLPLPIGLALFKGAPSAAAATSVPTIGLASAGSGTSGTGAAGTAGATSATTTGGAVGGSLAGGLVVKVVAVVVTAAVAAAVGYKGVQAVRDKPAKPAPAHVKTQAKAKAKAKAKANAVADRPSAPAPVSTTGAKHVQKPHANGKQHAALAGKSIASPGPTTHERSAPPALTHAGPVVPSGPATGAGPSAGGSQTHAPASPEQVESPKPNPKPAAGRKQTPPAKGVSQPKTPGGNATTPPGTTQPQTPPATGSTAPGAPQPGAPAPDAAGPATAPTSGTPAGGTPQSGVPQTATPQPGAPETEPPAAPSPTPTPPATQPPPTTPPTTQEPPTTPPASPPDDATGDQSGSPGDPSDDGNNGAEHGEKNGHHKGNHDGKHPEDS